MSTFTQYQQKATAALKRFKDNPTTHYIAGEFYASGNTYTNTTPIDNSSLGEVAEGDESVMDRACAAAADASREWQELPAAQRKKLLHRCADHIAARAEEIAVIETTDSGQPIRFMKQAALRGAENFRFFADKISEASNGHALYQPTHTNYTMRTPIGPVGVITPWNTPFMLTTWKIAPALAAGCTVVHKPAELSPLSASLLVEIAAEVGFPDGVWNMVHGKGEVVGKRLTEHPAIKAIAFVGESITGSHIMRQGADSLKRVHFELGGKNPVIVFDDADLQRALDAVIFMIYSLNGQRCTSSSRLFIQNSIKDSFIGELKKRVAHIKIGHPLDPHTEIGPLIHPDHLQKVINYIDIARQEGATIACGGTKCNLGDNYIMPTLITDANNKMRVAREEIFGPVLTVIGFDDEQESIHLANDSEYGLAAYLWTNNTGRIMRLARTIETGMLWVNSENKRNLPSPFGGVKKSGIGRDGGDYSFDFYMETKNVCVAHDTHDIPLLGR